MTRKQKKNWAELRLSIVVIVEIKGEVYRWKIGRGKLCGTGGTKESG